MVRWLMCVALTLATLFRELDARGRETGYAVSAGRDDRKRP